MVAEHSAIGPGLAANLRVDGARLWKTLLEIGEIGATPGGGCRRLALTSEDRAARELFMGWAREAGAKISVDRIGNIFCRRAGSQDALPPVMLGSHLDTVPTGGKFDGALGVIAALEVLRTLEDRKIRTLAPIELVVWMNEEGSRFSPSMMGSAVFAGDLPFERALAIKDPGGTTVAAALAETGIAGEAPIGGRPVAAYLELHNEQGPILEAEGTQIGIVTGTFTARYFVATVTGEPAHVGPTPMEARRDALVGAAEAILAIDRIGRGFGPDGRSNAPHLEVYPNVRGVIPAEVKLSCDVRHADPTQVAAMEILLRSELAAIGARRGINISLEQYFQFGPMQFDAELVATFRDAARSLGYTHRDILTVAGHDTVPMRKICPSAMIFTPSIGGISHNEREFTSAAQAEAGCNVLLHAVLARTGVATA
jgi:beta-ureidopropionase / N-carbamoyl-L-amino-acid hydrolase